MAADDPKVSEEVSPSEASDGANYVSQVPPNPKRSKAAQIATGIALTVTIGAIGYYLIIGIAMLVGVGGFFSSMSELAESRRNTNSYQYLESFAGSLGYEEVGTVIEHKSGRDGEKSSYDETDNPPRIDIVIQGSEAFATLSSNISKLDRVDCKVSSEKKLDCTQDGFRAELKVRSAEVATLTVTDVFTQRERDDFRVAEKEAATAKRLRELAPEYEKIDSSFRSIGYESAGRILSDEIDPDDWMDQHRKITYSGTDSFDKLKTKMLKQSWSCTTRAVNEGAPDEYEAVICADGAIELTLKPTWNRRDIELIAEISEESPEDSSPYFVKNPIYTVEEISQWLGINSFGAEMIDYSMGINETGGSALMTVDYNIPGTEAFRVLKASIPNMENTVCEDSPSDKSMSCSVDRISVVIQETIDGNTAFSVDRTIS